MGGPMHPYMDPGGMMGASRYEQEAAQRAQEAAQVLGRDMVNAQLQEAERMGANERMMAEQAARLQGEAMYVQQLHAQRAAQAAYNAPPTTYTPAATSPAATRPITTVAGPKLELSSGEQLLLNEPCEFSARVVNSNKRFLQYSWTLDDVLIRASSNGRGKCYITLDKPGRHKLVVQAVSADGELTLRTEKVLTGVESDPSPKYTEVDYQALVDETISRRPATFGPAQFEAMVDGAISRMSSVPTRTYGFWDTLLSRLVGWSLLIIKSFLPWCISMFVANKALHAMGIAATAVHMITYALLTVAILTFGVVMCWDI